MQCVAVDIAIVSEKKADHTRMLNCMEKTMKKYNLNINVRKTNIRGCGKKRWTNYHYTRPS
jgi:hypothetical protein